MLNGGGAIWTSVLKRFEQHAPTSVMVHTAMDHAVARERIDATFEEYRQQQYSGELLFSTMIELVTLVSLGLRPSLHAAARNLETLPVSLSALYDEVSRTEPAILRRRCAAALSACGPWPLDRAAASACQAGRCVCSTAITCQSARPA
jgi:hypothetical protein